VRVDQVAPGLWTWTGPHPDWTPDQGAPDGWSREVTSVYCEARDEILLVDPIVPADDEGARFWRALDRDVERCGTPTVLLTCAWHARSTGDVVARYRAPVWVHAGGVADLPEELAPNPFTPADPLPGGASALPGAVGGDDAGEVLLWLPSHAALVAGDVLLGGGPAGIRVCPDSWLEGQDPAAVRAVLREQLAALRVERVLVTHGDGVVADARAALDAALS
jgi:hypothetical protein